MTDDDNNDDDNDNDDNDDDDDDDDDDIRSLNIVRCSHSSYRIVLMAKYDHRFIPIFFSLFK